MGSKCFIVATIWVCIAIVSCSPVKIIVDQERAPLGQYEDIILVIPEAIHGYDLSGLRAKLQQRDIFADAEKQKIGKIVLSGESQDLIVPSIYDAAIAYCREMGGNYIVATRVKLNRFGKGNQLFIADIFYVSDFKGLERKRYWGPDKELKLEDFKADYYQQKGIFLEENFASLYVNKDYTFIDGILHNVFVKEKYACPDCDKTDLYRENLKFDIIELYQRKQVKLFHKMMKDSTLRSPLFLQQPKKKTYTYIDTINQKFDAVNKIDNLETLMYIQSSVNKQIEELDTFRYKTFIIANGP